MSAGEGGMHTMCSKAANTRGVTVKLLPGCAVYKMPHAGSEEWKGACVFSPLCQKVSKDGDIKDAGNILEWMGMPVPLRLLA